MVQSKLQQIIKENGLKVVEARKGLTITVKACDVKGSKRKNPEHCVFAAALKRERGAKRAIFMRSAAYIQTNGKLTRYILSNPVRNEIIAYDRGGKIVPGEYELKAPTKKGTLKAIKQAQKRLYRTGKRKRNFGVRHRMAKIRTVQW